jgi:hypothetical protein
VRWWSDEIAEGEIASAYWKCSASMMCQCVVCQILCFSEICRCRAWCQVISCSASNVGAGALWLKCKCVEFGTCWCSTQCHVIFLYYQCPCEVLKVIQIVYLQNLCALHVASGNKG